MSQVILKDFWQHAEETGHSLNARFVEIPENLAKMTGEVQAEPVEMHSQAWKSSRITWARSTHLFSPQRIQMFNFTIYPSCSYAAPIFASDFVILGNKLRIGLVDAMPLYPNQADYQNQWLKPFAKWHQQSLRIAEVYERKLDWSFKYLSKYACLATAAPLDTLPAFLDLWQHYLDTYLAILHNSELAGLEKQAYTKAWFADYNRSHLAVENKRNPLLHYFGKALGEQYNARFLFHSEHIV